MAKEAGWWWEVRTINPSVCPKSKPVASLLQLGYEYANFWKNKLGSNGVSTELLRTGKGSQEQCRNEKKGTHRSALLSNVIRGDRSIALESLSAMTPGLPTQGAPKTARDLSNEVTVVMCLQTEHGKYCIYYSTINR